MKVNKISNHPLYGTWKRIKQRCYNPKHHKFKDYGARGIYVCSEWLESFPQFVTDMGERPAGTSIDRIDNDGPYCKDNCRWATRSVQQRNTRKSINACGYIRKGLKFMARALINNKIKCRVFNTEEEANVWFKQNHRTFHTCKTCTSEQT